MENLWRSETGTISVNPSAIDIADGLSVFGWVGRWQWGQPGSPTA